MIATDPDTAGWQAAQRAFWRLAALRANPGRLTLPDGVDPADLLRTEGAGALADRLSGCPPLAAAMIDRLVAERIDKHSDNAARIWLSRDLARLIGALPPDQWLQPIQQVAERLDLPLVMVRQEVLEAGTKWTDDPGGCAARGLATLRSAPSAQRVKVAPPPPNADPATALDPGQDRDRRLGGAPTR